MGNFSLASGKKLAFRTNLNTDSRTDAAVPEKSMECDVGIILSCLRKLSALTHA